MKKIFVLCVSVMAFASADILAQCPNGQCSIWSNPIKKNVVRYRVVSRGGVAVDEPWVNVDKNCEAKKSEPSKKLKRVDAAAFEIEVISLVNANRIKAGLNPLETYTEGCIAARHHSHNMASWGRLQHTSGYSECVAMISGQAQAVVSLWLNSPPHRAIIMGQSRTKISVGSFNHWHTLRVW